MTAKNNEKAGPLAGEMTLEDALAVYLYFLEDGDTIGEREERIIGAAWEIIERHAKRAIAFLESGSAQ